MLIFWYLVSIIAGTDAVPYPHLVMVRLIQTIPKVAVHFFASFKRLIIGLVVSICFGVIIGIKLGLKPRLSEVVSPLVQALHPIPKSALTPVFIVLFGIGELSKILLIIAIAIIPIILSVRDAIKTIDQNFFYTSENMELTTKTFYKSFIIPAILPAVLTAIKIAIGTSIAVLYLSESIAATAGLGYYIGATSGISNIDMFVGIMLLSMLGSFLIILVEVIERKYCYWVTIK